ncbi:MAG: hypothetical protein ACYCYM_03815 [Saccharofermentanales bacterium]
MKRIPFIYVIILIFIPACTALPTTQSPADSFISSATLSEEMSSADLSDSSSYGISSSAQADSIAAASSIFDSASLSQNSSRSSSLSRSQSGAASSGSSSLIDWGELGGTKLILQYPEHGSTIQIDNPVFKWTDIKADDYTFYLDIKIGSGYRQLLEISGIRSAAYKPELLLNTSSTYRWRVEGRFGDQYMRHYLGSSGGAIFMTKDDPKKHPANIGKNFHFDGSISEEVLKNYLSRSMTLSFISSPSSSPASERSMIIRTGAKYIGRSIIPWQAETEYTFSIAGYKKVIDEMHAIDPEIVFETCIFETVWESCNGLKIPDWVFKAFNVPVESRNFNYGKMLFPSGKYVDHWESGCSVPDITQIETQMYFYYRACKYIDAGFEAIHWGQVMLIGSNDTGYADYQRVLTMVRKYAKTNARRHFVINNAHVHGMTGPDGKLLFDFHSFPIRGKIPAGEIAHAPSEDNPQKVLLEKGNLDSIYGNSMGGMTVSGWRCNSLPYTVELDNGGGHEPGYLNRPDRAYWIWGMDDISWFANQPLSYRSSWLQYAYGWVQNNDPAGNLMMPGSRPIYLQSLGAMTWYYATSAETTDFGWGDEEAIQFVWTKDNQ